MAGNRKSFEDKAPKPEKFDTLLKKNKRKPIEINGEFNFSNDALTTPNEKAQKAQANAEKERNYTSSAEAEFFNAEKPTKVKKSKRKRGRPVIVKDERYKVNKPKMISAALESKLFILEDYVEEFQGVTGRITFEKYIDTLAEFYITQKLGVAKEEHLREELEEGLEELKTK